MVHASSARFQFLRELSAPGTCPCNYHWIEAVVGVDAKIYGPLHLGWSLRYKRRIAHKEEGDFGNTWYVPGFGIFGDTRLGGTFNVIIDI